MQYQLFTCELIMKRITGMEFEIIKLYKLSPFLLWAGCNSAQWKQWVHCSIGPIQYVVYGTGPLCSMNSRGKILRLNTLFDLAYLKWFIYCHKKFNDSVRNWDLPMTFVPGPISLTFPNAILIQWYLRFANILIITVIDKKSHTIHQLCCHGMCKVLMQI